MADQYFKHFRTHLLRERQPEGSHWYQLLSYHHQRIDVVVLLFRAFRECIFFCALLSIFGNLRNA